MCFLLVWYCCNFVYLFAYLLLLLFILLLLLLFLLLLFCVYLFSLLFIRLFCFCFFLGQIQKIHFGGILIIYSRRPSTSSNGTVEVWYIVGGPLRSLKTSSGLESVPRCEPLTYQSINRLLIHCVTMEAKCMSCLLVTTQVWVCVP